MLVIPHSLSDSSESQGGPRKLSVVWLRLTDKKLYVIGSADYAAEGS